LTQHKASQNEDSYFPSFPPCNGGIFSPAHRQAAKVTFEICNFSKVCRLINDIVLIVNWPLTVVELIPLGNF
jgi:hypothetical protein